MNGWMDESMDRWMNECIFFYCIECIADVVVNCDVTAYHRKHLCIYGQMGEWMNRERERERERDRVDGSVDG